MIMIKKSLLQPAHGNWDVGGIIAALGAAILLYRVVDLELVDTAGADRSVVHRPQGPSAEHSFYTSRNVGRLIDVGGGGASSRLVSNRGRSEWRMNPGYRVTGVCS